MFFHDVTHPYPEDKSITFDQLEADLLLDLMTIGQLEGEFSFDDAGLKYASEWGEENAPMELLKNDKLGGYLNRRKMHVAKLAMIHSIMTKDELVITEEDWRFGVWSIGTIEPNLSKVFGGVGKNKYTTEIDKIVMFVKNMNFFTEKVVPRSEILVNFQHSAEPRALNDLIGFAVDSKLLMCKEKWVKGEKDYDFWVPEFTPREETV
jgi:hypothetical protein